MLVGFGFERSATATTTGRVGIGNAESSAGQFIGVIDRRAAQIAGANFIDEKLDAVAFDHFIASLLPIERHAVLHPGAAAAFHENTQAFALLGGLFGEQILKLFDRAIGDGDHCGFEANQRDDRSQTAETGASRARQLIFCHE